MNHLPNIYQNYRITNKLICRVIDTDYNGKWKLKLNANRFILNRSNYDYWKNNIEVIELHCDSTFTFDELDEIRIQIMSNLNSILKCIELENYKEISKLYLIINNQFDLFQSLS